MTNTLVIGSHDEATVPAPFVLLEAAAERTVRGLLERRGCTVLFVDVAHRPLPDVTELLAGVSGLVLLGGADIDPTLYGLLPDQPNLDRVDREADEFSIAVVHRADELAIPMLCICRGMQVLNVARGGTLIPDIENWAIHHGPTQETIFVVEEVMLAAESRLAAMLGQRRLSVLNGHHQAVDVVGTGLIATARATDGLIEAIETDRNAASWAVGVQWHPEHPDADPTARTAIIDGFMAAIADRRRR